VFARDGLDEFRALFLVSDVGRVSMGEEAALRDRALRFRQLLRVSGDDYRHGARFRHLVRGGQPDA
jgi:hypothetical protein